jgi:hypothetical protein
MDPNLTTPIILNATLTQPPQGILSNPTITTLLGIMIGWFLNLSSSTIQEKRKLESENLQKQKQVYSQLLGIKDATCQVYSNLSENVVMFYWLKARDNNHLDKLEAYENTCEYDRRISEGLMVIPNNTQKFWETIGLIEVSFSPSKDLKKLIELTNTLDKEFILTWGNVVKKFNNAQPASLTEDSIDNACKQFYETIENSCEKPLSQLAEHLKSEIAIEESKLKKNYWKIWK